MDEKHLQEFTDQLESLHRRQDKFYEWAGVLQKEMRSVQQRLAFLESQSALDLGPGREDQTLLERLEKLKQQGP